MLGVCLCAHSKDEINNQWSYILTSWSIENVYLHSTPFNPFSVGPNKLKHLRDASCINTFDDLPNDVEIVLLASQKGPFISGETNLVNFVHPLNCIYVFGNDDANMKQELFGKRTPDHIVYIPTNEELSAHTAGAIVLYDRVSKNG